MNERFIELTDAHSKEVIVYRVLCWIFLNEKEYGIMQKANFDVPADIMVRDDDDRLWFVTDQDEYRAVYTYFMEHYQAV